MKQLIELDSEYIDSYRFKEWICLIDEVIECDNPDDQYHWLVVKDHILTSVAEYGAMLDRYGTCCAYRFTIKLPPAFVTTMINWLSDAKAFLRDTVIKLLAHKKKQQSLSSFEDSYLLDTRLQCWRKSQILAVLNNALNSEGDEVL